MEKERTFRRKYSLNVARLGTGKYEESFELDQAFFEYFEESMVREGNVETLLKIEKYPTHMDVGFELKGEVMLSCDRCESSYPHSVDHQYRIIYSFDEEMNFEGYEVMYVNTQESHLDIVQELYDFIHLSIPMRKVPPKEVHLCAPNVLALLGLDAEGNRLEEEEESEEETIDPRWSALKNIKDQLDG
jgi:uncharacterized metal-binding protein YceD (DUF177 family)